MIDTQWTIEFTETVDHQFEKLDQQVRHRINRYLYIRIAQNENPKRFGKPLVGNLKNFWCYRIGDYRVICEILDHKLIIIVVNVAHRREVYKKLYLVKPFS